MLKFRADEFFAVLREFFELEHRIGLIFEEKGGNEKLTESQAARARFVINALFFECERAALFRPLERQERLEQSGILGQDQTKYTLETVKWELMELRMAVLTDLHKRVFLRLEDSSEDYYEQTKLFGDAVAERFPKGAYDINEAGSCLAAGRYTASVFHLMRVAEYGLRALAKKLKVKSPTTFELKTWDELIREVERQIQAIIQKPKTRRRSKDLEFYNTVAPQFRYFKDGWRNLVMHTRTNYDEHQAISVMVHVREFMQLLATRLKG